MKKKISAHEPPRKLSSELAGSLPDLSNLNMYVDLLFNYPLALRILQIKV